MNMKSKIHEFLNKNKKGMSKNKIQGTKYEVRGTIFNSLLFAVLFFSCGTSQQNEPAQTSGVKTDSVQPSAERVISKEDFVSVLKSITIANINQYINREKGLWLINSSGAMPNMSNTTQVDKNFPVDFSAAKNEELAKVNCDSKTFWTKDGCYAEEINKFKDEKIWVYCSLDKEEVPKVAELAQTISYTVINTALNARYYFSQIAGKWYLTVVDLRRPCEA